MPIVLSAPAKRKNTRAKTVPMADVKAAVLAGANGGYLTDVARSPALRGVHFARIEAAAEALAKAGKVVYDGATVTRKNTRKTSLPPMRNNGAGSVVIYDASGKAVNRSKNLAGIIRHARNRLVESINVSPSGVLSVRWEDGTHVDTPFADASVAVEWAKSREWFKGVPVTRKNGSRKDVLSEDARKSGYYVATYSPGDGKTRYRFFDLADMARRGVSTAEQDYFGPLNGIHTAVGLAAAKKFLNAPAKRTNGSRSVADPVAARELELYIENERNLVGPGNSIGANVMRMLAGRIVRGTYDSTKAWKAWVPLVTEGAKRYKREHGAINANKATRDAVATRLSEAFEGEIRVGALDPMKLLGARNNRGMPVAQGNQMPQTRSNSATAVPPLSEWEKGDYAYVVSGSGMLRGQQLVIQNLSSVGSAWVAYTRSESRPGHVSVAFADDAGTGFYGMTEDGLRREYSRFSHATPGAARAVLVKASRWYGSRR
jgi:hypothetical protein